MPTEAGLMVQAARLVAHDRPLRVEEVYLGEPRDGDVVVEMAYAGVNPVDRYVVHGRLAPDGPLPRTVGVEGVGRVGDRWVVVHDSTAGLATLRDGVWAEAALVPRDALVDVPEGVDPVAAAAMGVAGATAWRVVHEWAAVTPVDRVLVLGASGGVGSMIVSLVATIGAVVWGQTGDEAKVDWLRELGASHVVVSDAEGLSAAVEELEPTVVFDPLGGDFTGEAIHALGLEGRLVIFGTSAAAEGRVPLQDLYRKSLRVLGYGGLSAPGEVLRRATGEALQAVRDDRMRVVIDSVLPLSDVNVALDRLARRDVRGKLVLDLRRGPSRS